MLIKLLSRWSFNQKAAYIRSEGFLCRFSNSCQAPSCSGIVMEADVILHYAWLLGA